MVRSKLKKVVNHTESVMWLEKCHRLKIKVPPTAFQTEIQTLTATLSSDLDCQIVNAMRAMVMTHTHAKGQGYCQRSFGGKVRLETRSDEGDCIVLMPTRLRYVYTLGDLKVITIGSL